MTHGPLARPVVGVLSVHGAVAEHLDVLRRVGADARPVGDVDGLERVDGLVIPGGESTVLRLAAGDDLLGALRRRVGAGLPTFGTCAGLIALARDIAGGDVPIAGVLDVTVNRNGYGRQVASCEAQVRYLPPFDADGAGLGVFIRAPRITRVGPGVDVVATWGDDPVAVRQGDVLATAYHPELTDDERLHRWIVDRARAYHRDNGNGIRGEGRRVGAQ